tara:strand:- start:2527 stop:2985 length:459 start_codon:yes stop_codon:yes gene_type:complete
MPGGGTTSARASGGKRPRTKAARKKAGITKKKKVRTRAAEPDAATAAAQRIREMRDQSVRMCMRCRLSKRWAEKPSQCDLCELRALCIDAVGAVHSQSRGFTPDEINRGAMLDTITDPNHVRRMMRIVNRASRLFGDEAVDKAAVAFTEGGS